MLLTMHYRATTTETFISPGFPSGAFALFRASAPDEPPGKNENDDESHISVVIQARPETRRPAMYKVLMLNDDYTPMEFVVHVLERFFSKSREEATNIMLNVHKKGVGICGVFTFEVAESKVTQVMDLARQNQHPLQCMIEKA